MKRALRFAHLVASGCGCPTLRKLYKPTVLWQPHCRKECETFDPRETLAKLAQQQPPDPACGAAVAVALEPHGDPHRQLLTSSRSAGRKLCDDRSCAYDLGLAWK